MEAQELLLTNNNIVQNQLTRICSDLTDEQVRFAHEAVDVRGISNVVVHLYWSVMNRSMSRYSGSFGLTCTSAAGTMPA